MTDVAELGFSVDSRPIDKAESSLDKLSNAAKRTETATEKMNREADNASKRMQAMTGSSGTLTATLTRMAGAITAALSVRQIQQYADTWSDLSSRVRLAIGPGQNAADVMSRLSDIARMTYSSLESTAESFTRNAMTLTALGKTTQQQLDFTEALNNALVVSGAKGMAFESAQVAIGKAMAEGTLRGDELNNILNNGGRIAQLLAEDLGTNVTQLRKLAADGKITGDVIYNSLIKNMETLRKEAESMPATIGDAFTLIRNAILESVGVYDQQNGLSETLAENLVKVADAIRNTDWSPYINGLTTAAKLYAAYLIAVKAYPAAAAAWVVAIRLKTAALAAFSMQAAMTRKTLLSMNTALSVVGAAFAGWQIGTYLREEFEIVEKAGIALMSGLHQAAIAIGGVFKGLGETIKFALTSPLSFVWGRIVSFLEMIQGLGASAAKALGFEGLAEVIGQDLAHLRTTTDQEYRATIQGIVDTTKAEMAGVSDVYFELFDSVGKKAKEAGSAIEESAKNTGGTVTNTITEEMSKADKAYAKFRANLELTIQSTNLMSAAYLTSAEAVEEVTIQQEIESEVLKQGAQHREEITRLIREQHAANKALDLSKTIADMRTQNAELKAYEAALIAGGDATEAGRQALEAYNDQREIEATLVGKTSKEIDKLLPKLREEQKIRRGQRARNKEVEELNGLVNETRTAQEKANAELERLEKMAKNAKTPEHLEAIRRKTVEVKSSMSEWGKFTERAIDSVDQAFANAWKNIDQGFSSFADGLKNAFKNLLAELAHMAITRPIIMQFASMLGVGNGTQGQSSGFLGGLFGGGSSSGGGGIGGALQGANQIRSIGSMWSGAQALWPALQGGWANGGFSGALGAAGSYIGSMFGIGSGTAGSLAAGSQISGYTGAAMSKWVAAQTANTAATSTLSSTMSSMTGMLSNPYTWIIAGMVASNKLYGDGVRADGSKVRDTFKESGSSGAADVLGDVLGGASSAIRLMDKALTHIFVDPLNLFGDAADRFTAVITGSPVTQAVNLALARLFGGGEKYKRTVGSATGGYADGEYTSTGPSATWFPGARQFGEEHDATLDDLNEAFNLALGGLFDAFEVDSSIATTARTRLRRTSGAMIGDFITDIDGEITKFYRSYSKNAKIGEAFTQYADDIMGEYLAKSIVSSDLPEYFRQQFEPLANNKTTAEDVANKLADIFGRFESVNSILETINLAALELTDAGLRASDALIALSGGLDALQASYSTYYDAFFSEAEKIEDTIDSITRAFKEADVTLVSSRSEYRAMVESIDLTTEAGREMFATLMQLSGQAAQYYDILEARAAEAINAAGNAFRALQSSINAEVSQLRTQYQAAQASANGLLQLSNSLQSALRSMRMDSDAFDQARRKQAQAQLSAALAVARAGGSLQGVDLSGALSELGRDSTQFYGSFEDYARDYWKTAHDINSLDQLAGKQLSVEEKTLAAIESQISYYDQMLIDAQNQLYALQGIDTSVMSVAAALANFKAALGAAETAKNAAKPASSASDAIRSTYESVLGRAAAQSEINYWLQRIGAGTATTGNLAELFKGSDEYRGKVPGFASGGFHSGGLRLVGEYGPELEVTGPSRIYNAGQTAAMLGGGADVAEALTRLQQTVERQGDALRSIAKHAMQTARRVEFLERWDYDGLPPERDVA